MELSVRTLPEKAWRTTTTLLRHMRSHWLAIVFTILIAGFVLLVTLAAKQSLSGGQQLVEILEVLVSWPIAILILALAFGIRFQQQIASFLEKIATFLGEATWIRFGGRGFWTEAQRQVPSKALTEEDKKLIELTAEQYASVVKDAEQLQKELQSVVNQQIREEVGEHEAMLDTAVRMYYEELLKESLFWEFEYLSLFLAPATKYLLRCISNRLSPLANYLLSPEIRHQISDPTQNQTMHQVLLDHGLIKQENGDFRITDKGKQFLKHMDAKRL